MTNYEPITLTTEFSFNCRNCGRTMGMTLQTLQQEHYCPQCGQELVNLDQLRQQLNDLDQINRNIVHLLSHK